MRKPVAIYVILKTLVATSLRTEDRSSLIERTTQKNKIPALLIRGKFMSRPSDPENFLFVIFTIPF
jgi:hypothetical protein